MGAHLATAIAMAQKQVATEEGKLYLTVKELTGGIKKKRDFEAGTIKALLMTFAAGKIGDTIDPDGLEKNDKDKKTPLMVAARMGHVEVCAVLITGGADPNKKSATWETPLILACRGNSGHFPPMRGENRAAVVQLLLDSDADPNARDLVGNNALKWACQNQLEEVIFKLLEHPKHFVLGTDVPVMFRIFDMNGQDELADRVQAHFDKKKAIANKGAVKRAQEKVDRQARMIKDYKERIDFLLSFAVPDRAKINDIRDELVEVRKTDPEVFAQISPLVGGLNEEQKKVRKKKIERRRKQASKTRKRRRYESGRIPKRPENDMLPEELPMGMGSWVKCPYETDWARESVRLTLGIHKPKEDLSLFDPDKIDGWKRKGRNMWVPGRAEKVRKKKDDAKVKPASGMRAVIEAGRCYLQSKIAIRRRREAVRAAPPQGRERWARAPPDFAIFPEA